MANMSFYTLAASFFLLLISRAVSKQCTMKCSDSMQHPSTSLYALKISQHYYNPNLPIYPTVTVYSTECPNVDTPGPSWYKIDVFADEVETLVGKFKEPRTRNESRTINQESMIEFSTSDPFVITDLPITYNWTKPAGNDGRICFRLTLLASDSEGNGCRLAIKCMVPIGYEGPGSGEMVDMFQPLISVQKKADLYNTTETFLKCQKDCSKSKQGLFCTLPRVSHEENKQYSSRCEWQIEKCTLKDQGVNVKSIDLLPCSKIESTHLSKTPCWDEIENNKQLALDYPDFIIPWNPVCTCTGQFKPVLCYGGQCGCVDKFGTAVEDFRSIQCTDPEAFEGFLNRCVRVL